MGRVSNNLQKPWRPKVGERVEFNLDGQRRTGRVSSYEGKNYIAVDMDHDTSRARFFLSELGPFRGNNRPGGL